MSAVDRRTGFTGSVALKVPCRVATTAAITLSGLQTIDGVDLVADDRVLVKDQADATFNGIYVVDTGRWQRPVDFNGPRDVVQGTLVYVHSGGTNRPMLFALATASPVIGTSELEFTELRQDMVWADGFATASEAASFAWSQRRPLFVNGAQTATLTIDPAVELGADNDAHNRHRLMMELCRWHGTCVVAGRSAIAIRFVDGLHTMTAWNALGTGVPVNYCDRTNPPLRFVGGAVSLIPITSIAYGARGADDVYPITVGVSTALPAHVVPNYGVGLRNVMGDLDAESATGGLKILTIASDRLSFTAETVCPRTQDLESPTTIDTTTLFASLLPSRVVVPTVCFGIETEFDGGGSMIWNGGNHEGYWNVVNGGNVEFDSIGTVWTGGKGSPLNHDIVFIRDTGSYFSASRSVMVGSGERLVRGFAPAQIFLNQCCLGGGNSAHSGVVIQGGTFVHLTRTSLGGFSNVAAIAGEASNITCSGAVLASSLEGIRAIGAGASASIPATRLPGNLRGARGIGLGQIQGASTTYFTRNSEALDFLAGSYAYGDMSLPTYDAITTPLGNYSVLPGNTVVNGGGWFQDSIKPLSDPGVRISLPANTGKATIPLITSGAAGAQITGASQVTSTVGFSVQANITTVPAITFEVTYAGADVIVGTGDPAPTPGSVTVSVFLDVDDIMKLVVVNGQTATRAWYLKVDAGNVSLGTPVVTS